MPLCEDLKDGSLTWHIGCSDYPIDFWVGEFRKVIESKISNNRGRALKILEVYTRDGKQYLL